MTEQLLVTQNIDQRLHQRLHLYRARKLSLNPRLMGSQVKMSTVVYTKTVVRFCLVFQKDTLHEVSRNHSVSLPVLLS